jgi:glutaredoxin 3
MAVVIYSSDWCPYCIRAKSLLRKKNVGFEEICVDRQAELRAEMSAKSGSTSVPQIWIGTRHIGGCDDLYALESKGELNKLLAADR